MMRNKINLVLIVLISIFFVFSSCKTIDKCAENPELGNLGSILNSNLDEHSPSILRLPVSIKEKYKNQIDTNDYLYYTTTRYDQGAGEKIYRAELNNLNLGIELLDDANFPLNDTSNFRNAGLPVFYYNFNTNKLELYFAALPKKGRLSRDIFYSELDLETSLWTPAKSLPSINTASYESHPAISPNGKILVFSSDRNDGLGDIDIWYSHRMEDNSWSEPVNLGSNINTKETDYTPSFLPNGTLLFASNGLNKNRKDFDIFHAQFDTSSNNWSNPVSFNYPINSEFDETGPAVYNNIIYLASNRRGGCGGKDIYSFHLCGPVLLSGEIKSLEHNILLDGDIFLKDSIGNILAHSEISSDGKFNLGVIQAFNTYFIDYKNRCFPTRTNFYDFSVPCSDSSAVSIIIQMSLPKKNEKLELQEIDVPYFVTGYYKPNTENNLNALRLKFSYNLFNNSTKTKYIENPGANYDKFTSQVEASLNDVVKYIANMLANVTNLCLPEENRGILKIRVQGWADPRPISENSEYVDADIDDKIFNFKVSRGTKMNNELLAKLRAYYTAKYFETELEKYCTNSINNINKYIKWEIEGMGIDDSEDTDLELKRKVRIILDYKE